MLIDVLNVRIWAMEAVFFSKAYPIAMELISRGEDLSRLISSHTGYDAQLFPQASERDQVSGFPIFKSANGKNVGVLRVIGGTTKHGELCAYGTQDYAQFLQLADTSEHIDAIVIEGDTPGGSVDGTNELGMTIKELSKPVITFADSMLASAGVWWGVHADEVFANANNPTEIGSIGTLFVYDNYTNVIEAGNFPNVEIIRAPQSKDKAAINSFEPLKEADEQKVIDDLRKITEDFKSTVIRERGDRLRTGDEDIFTGKMYDADDALRMGLIDAVGSRQDAIDRAGELAEMRQKTEPAGSGHNNYNMNSKLISFLLGGKADAEATEHLSAEEMAELQAAKQELTEKVNRIAELEKEVATLTEKDKQHEEKIEALEETKKVHEQTIADQEAKLEEEPAGHRTTVIAKDNEFGEENPFETSVDQEVKKMKELMYSRTAKN